MYPLTRMVSNPQCLVRKHPNPVLNAAATFLGLHRSWICHEGIRRTLIYYSKSLCSCKVQIEFFLKKTISYFWRGGCDCVCVLIYEYCREDFRKGVDRTVIRFLKYKRMFIVLYMREESLKSRIFGRLWIMLIHCSLFIVP